MTVVAEPVEPPELFEWFVETRERLGMRVIPLSPTAGTDVLAGAARQRGGLPARATATSPATASTVEFFGERTTLPGGPAMLALRGRRAAAPAGVLLPDHGDGTRRHPPAARHRARSGRLRDDVARVTQDLAHRFEDADPGGTRALAPAAAQLAQRPDRVAGLRPGPGDDPGG